LDRNNWTAWFFGILACAGNCLFAQSPDFRITPEKLLSLASLPSPRPAAFGWLPDSKRVVFSIAEPDDDKEKGATWVEIMDVRSGERTRLTKGSNAKPSPDGLRIAYLSGEEAQKSIAVYDLRSGSSHALAPMSGGTEGFNFGFSWSPDSQKIAYGYRPEKPKLSEDAKKATSSVVVIGGEGDLPPDSEAWVVDVNSGAKQKVTSGPYLFANPRWFPDGKSFLFTQVGSFEYRNDNMYGKVAAVSVPGAEVRTIVKDSGVQHLAPAVSPDGTHIAFRYDPNNIFYPYYDNIAMVPAGGGPVNQLSRNIFVSSGPIWAPDSRTIYFVCKEGAYSQLCSVTTSGELKRLIKGPHNVANVSVSPDGQILLLTTEDARGRAEIRSSRSDGTGERTLVDLTPPDIKQLALGEVDEISWKSHDGLVNHGLVIKPASYQPGKRYPLLVDLHGGPIGGVSLMGSVLLKTPLEFHMWASRGFVVFAADYRTSEIAGWDPLLKAREKSDFNDRDTDDIMTGIDFLVKQGVADPSRLALLGHSNGSFLANWLITHTNRFRVAVSYEGIADQYISYGSGMRVGGNAFSEWMYKGKPWDVPQNYSRNSSSAFVKGVKTPTLFIANDYSGGSGVENLVHHEFMYTALKKQGVDTQLLMYRGEGHVVQRPENLRDLLSRVVAWVDTHMSK
jgi:dipeptidyl aminopeptidase/acylaminoacyl peptidase